MNCCANCFSDPSLIEIIRSNSLEIGNCDFCGSMKIEITSCKYLSSYFEELFDLYTPSDNANKSLKINISVLIHDHLKLYWSNLFNIQLLDNKLIKLLVDCIAKEGENYNAELFQGGVELKGIQTETLFSTESLELQWDSFAHDIKYNNRFFLTEKLDTDFLQSVFERLGKTYNSGDFFFRARISDTLITVDNMGKPPVQITTGGRANPVGIPYLYVSNDLKTTLYEIRISLHETLCVGKFIAIDNINLISLTNISELGPFEIQNKGFELNEFIRIRPYLQKLESELSKPVRKQDIHLDYLPTQFLCEFFKSLGFDAVEYKSAMNPKGFNLALFNDIKVVCTESKLYKISNLDYGWEEI